MTNTMSESSIRSHLAQQERQRKVEEAMKALVDATNIMGGEADVAKGMLKGLQASHRTLQQSFFRAFVMMVKDYSQTQFFDLRNEASVEFCKKIVELIENEYLPFV